MAANWEPEPQGLQEVLGLLEQSQTPNSEVQRQVHRRIEELCQHAEFNSYLIYVLTKLNNQSETTRGFAGILLKNNVKASYNTMSSDVQEYIKAECIRCVGDSSPLVRATIGLLITTIASWDHGQELMKWPQLLPFLMENLNNPDMHVSLGCFSALHKLCEDCPAVLDSEPLGRPLTIIIPVVIDYFLHSEPKIRKSALEIVNLFIANEAEVLRDNFDKFLTNLFQLANDRDTEVQKSVCRAIVGLIETSIQDLLPHLPQIIEYMLHTTVDPDEELALEGCEFWLAITENRAFGAEEQVQKLLQGYLPKLIPVLMHRMRYSEADIILLKSTGGDDAHVPDKDEDIKPRHAKSKQKMDSRADQHGANKDQSENGDASHLQASPAPQNGDETDSEFDDDDDDDDDALMNWNLRKCSAAALDTLSTIYRNDCLPILVPSLQEKLQSSTWEDRECGILALGAIAEGCMSGLVPHFPQLLPFLIDSLNDKEALVRSITCWTISRYARFIVSEGPTKYLEPCMHQLLLRIKDNNKRVQEAACSAFATIEEQAGLDLVPYLQPILENLIGAFRQYQRKNLLILYDAIGTLADAVGEHLNVPQYVDILMPPLIEKWNALDDQDQDLFPLLECLSSVVLALRKGFLPYVVTVYQRCLRLLQVTIQQQVAAQHDPEIEEPDREFVVVSLDLLSGLLEGLGDEISELVVKSNLVDLLQISMTDPLPEVRQSSFALLGDLAKACFAHLEPFVPHFLAILMESLQPMYVSVCNNATWAVGEIAIRAGEQTMEPFVEQLTERLIHILHEKLPRTLLENSAITLGRLGYVCPQQVARHLDRFIKPWCISLRHIRDTKEKDSAFRGICRLIYVNPTGIGRHFAWFCDAIASWDNPDPELKEQFRSILIMCKSELTEEKWNQLLARFPPALSNRLKQQYDI